MGKPHIVKVNILEIVSIINLNLMNHAGARVNKPMCFEFVQVLIFLYIKI